MFPREDVIDYVNNFLPSIFTYDIQNEKKFWVQTKTILHYFIVPPAQPNIPIKEVSTNFHDRCPLMVAREGAI